MYQHEKCVCKKPIFLPAEVFHPIYVRNQYQVSQDSISRPPPEPLSNLLVNRYLHVPSKSSYKRLIIGTKLYLHLRMSASSRVPEGLKDSECKKGKLGIRPPILYVPPTDLLKTKEILDSLKVKLPDGTVFTMQIFAKGNPEEYLSHMQAVLRLIGNKGLDAQCKKLMKERNEQTTVLEALKLKSIGPPGCESRGGPR